MFASLDWNSIVTGIGTGIIASILFILMLYRVRPRFEISTEMARNEDEDTPDYIFKIINKSLLYKIHDLTCKFTVVTTTSSINAMDSEATEDVVELKKKGAEWIVNRLNYRHVFQFINPKKKLSTRTDYAIQFGTKSDILSLIKENKIVRLEVRATHPLSNTTKVKIMEYSNVHHVVDGDFCSGNTFRIM